MGNKKIEKKPLTKEERKKLIVKIVVFVIVLVLFVLTYTFYSKLFGENSVLNRTTKYALLNEVLSKIPSVVSSFQTIVIAYIVYKVIQFVMHKLLSRSNRGTTIVRLLQSFLRWVIIIVAILAILGAWGVDTSTLLASAGILTLVIGLGAQSLVADIVAGLFIVFEGEYQVGDIVVIDGWRGTVQEIGMRTTKIVDAGGNIKIINNSNISSIVNQTQDLSLAKCVMSIDYEESIPRVELVIRDNLDEIRSHIPAIEEGPYYKGINELGASSVNLLFVAKCKEEDIYQVQRDMTRELYMLFNKEHISIPFDQVVISQREAKQEVTTNKMIKDAAKFTDEQKELSKNIEEEQQ